MSRLILSPPPTATRAQAVELAADGQLAERLERPHQRRGEELVALACLFAALFAELVVIRFGIDAQDEGYFLEQATRVLQGQIPYRDFDSLYTPGLLYVHALVLSLFGGSPLIDLRVVGLVSRVVLALGLYLLCRSLVRPAIAVLPPLFILVGLDRVPSTWEPHPGWPSAALTILGVWAFMRLPSQVGWRRAALLIGLGAITGLAFVFKQNAGVLLGLALVLGLAWQGPTVTRPLRVIQISLLVLVLAATVWLIHPHASVPIAEYFILPLVAAAYAALRPIRVASDGRRLGQLVGGVVCLGIGFSLVSLPWMVALLSALNWDVDLVKSFVGVTNQDVLWYPLTGPGGGAWATLLALALALLLLVRARGWSARLLALLLALACGATMVVVTAEQGESLPLALLLAPGRAAYGWPLVLPFVSILAAALLSTTALPPRTAWTLRWLTVASAVTFLTQYPRVDEVHLTWSACLPLAIGAVVLAYLFTALARGWHVRGFNRYVLATALVLVPLASAARNLGVRSEGFVGMVDTSLPGSPAAGIQLASRTRLVDPPMVAGISVPTPEASRLIAAAQYVSANTRPREPIFVYPTAPLLYVLADRPNPTRFAHLYPGAASPSELTTVIGELARVNLVVVSESQLLFWGKPAQNTDLETYLANNYTPVAQFGDYYVLRRTPGA
ncbi:MAG: hypothetical protein JO352_16575 [Chloroflexi bacterium]|nr:hypothetical protein [Chloroflexota bacterium]